MDEAEIARNLEADRQYAALASKPENTEALTQLGIRDGESLQQFGNRVKDAGAVENGADTLAELRLRELDDPQVVAGIIQAAGASLEGSAARMLQDPNFAQAVASGGNPREAATEFEGLNALEEQAKSGEVVRGLGTLGVTQAEFRDLDDEDQAAYLAAGKAAAHGQYQAAVAELADAGVDAEEAITTAATRLQGTERTLLEDPAAVKGLLSSAEGQQAIDQIAAGKVGEGLALLNVNVPARVVEALAKDRTLQTSLETMGPTSGDLKAAGPAVAGLVQGALGDNLQQTIAALESNVTLRDRVIDHAAKDPAFQRGMQQAGLTTAQLKSAGKAADELVHGVDLLTRPVPAGSADRAEEFVQLGRQRP